MLVKTTYESAATRKGLLQRALPSLSIHFSTAKSNTDPLLIVLLFPELSKPVKAALPASTMVWRLAIYIAKS